MVYINGFPTNLIGGRIDLFEGNKICQRKIRTEIQALTHANQTAV